MLPAQTHRRAAFAGVYDCPDSDFMCKDPGLLTCLGALNDCSGKGDCLMGSCYCHSGFGGADCSVPACVRTIGCADVRSINIWSQSVHRHTQPPSSLQSQALWNPNHVQTTVKSKCKSGATPERSQTLSDSTRPFTFQFHSHSMCLAPLASFSDFSINGCCCDLPISFTCDEISRSAAVFPTPHVELLRITPF
jgi:hypothetical protein